MNHIALTAYVSAVILLCSACNETSINPVDPGLPDEPVASLNPFKEILGDDWRLVAVQNPIVSTSVNDSFKDFLLRFADSTVSGIGGCESFTADYKAVADGNSVRFDNTRRAQACSPVPFFDDYLMLLQGIETYELSTKQLQLITPQSLAGDIVLTYRKDNDKIFSLPELLTADDSTVDNIDPFAIISAEADCDILTVRVSYEGGCTDHEFSLSLGVGSFGEETEMSINIVLAHNAQGDACKTEVRKNLQFSLLPLRRLLIDTTGKLPEEPVELKISGPSTIEIITVQF